MLKKSLIYFSLVFCLNSFAAIQGAGLEAPTINGSANVSNPVQGEIIYDTASGEGFKGYTGSSWVNFEGDASTDTVKTPTTVNPVIVSATIASGTGKAVSGELGDWISGSSCSDATTGYATCTFETSFFSSTPNCICSSSNVETMCTVAALSSSSVRIASFDRCGNGLNDTKRIICHGVR